MPDDMFRNAERRRDVRVPARVDVRFGEAVQAAKAFRAYSLNISAGGLCLRPQRVYEIGTRLQLVIHIGDDVFEVVGQVAWARSGAIGVRFEQVDGNDRARLEATLASVGRDRQSGTT